MVFGARRSNAIARVRWDSAAIPLQTNSVLSRSTFRKPVPGAKRVTPVMGNERLNE